MLLPGQAMTIADVLIVNIAIASAGASLHTSGAPLQLIEGNERTLHFIVIIAVLAAATWLISTH